MIVREGRSHKATKGGCALEARDRGASSPSYEAKYGAGSKQFSGKSSVSEGSHVQYAISRATSNCSCRTLFSEKDTEFSVSTTLGSATLDAGMPKTDSGSSEDSCEDQKVRSTRSRAHGPAS